MDREQIRDFVFNYYTGHSANCIDSFNLLEQPNITLASVVDCIEKIMGIEHQRQLSILVNGDNDKTPRKL